MTANEPRTNTERRLTAAKRADAALQMRLRRATYREIAAALGYSNPGNAHRAVEREIAKVPRENATALRTQELEALDAMQARVMPSILDCKRPELWAIDRVLSIMDRRAKLTGLYDHTSTTSVDEFKAVLAAWAATITQQVDAEEASARDRGQDIERIEEPK
ncbi:hypothetical protein OR221_0362 [Microbacterium laevaniformans OR221]|nr:hypothetical protein OR221_0362 [Microbacterium laevaniformans OR221]